MNHHENGPAAQVLAARISIQNPRREPAERHRAHVSEHVSVWTPSPARWPRATRAKHTAVRISSAAWARHNRLISRPVRWRSDAAALLQGDAVFHPEPRQFQPEQPTAVSRPGPSLYVRSQTVRRREERYELALLSVLSGLAVVAVVLGTATGAQFAWRLDAIRDLAQRILH